MKTTAGWARKQGEIAEKEAQLAAMRKSGMPVLFLVLILALLTMVSALCGSLVGLPNGLHLITGPILAVVTLIRIPTTKKMNALATEIRQLKGE
jgi:hypothetical protein